MVDPFKRYHLVSLSEIPVTAVTAGCNPWISNYIMKVRYSCNNEYYHVILHARIRLFVSKGQGNSR